MSLEPEPQHVHTLVPVAAAPASGTDSDVRRGWLCQPVAQYLEDTTDQPQQPSSSALGQSEDYGLALRERMRRYPQASSHVSHFATLGQTVAESGYVRVGMIARDQKFATDAVSQFWSFSLIAGSLALLPRNRVGDLSLRSEQN